MANTIHGYFLLSLGAFAKATHIFAAKISMYMYLKKPWLQQLMSLSLMSLLS